MKKIVLFIGQEMKRINITSSESLKYMQALIYQGETENVFFYYSYQNLLWSYSPTQTNEKIFL